MKTIRSLCLAAAVAAVAGSIRAQEEEEIEEGAVGWTPIAVSLASPVQLPWGHAKWDVFGLDLGIFYNGSPKVYGLDVACATVCTDDSIGLIVGPVFNYSATDVYGMRATLIANICRGSVYGLEAGGFGYHNYVCGANLEFLGSMCNRLTGAAASLVFTMADEETCGCTIAGGVNLATKAYGCQVAGVFNMTDELHGCQIGLVNYARECPWGFQIGLVNIILDNKVKVLPIVNGYF